MRIRELLRWNERSEPWKMVVSLAFVILITLSGYTIFSLAMGSTTPLVVVTSGSMEPNLYQGDLLAIQARSEDQIAVDDIIVFNADWHETPIVHRVIEILRDTKDTLLFKTKGDNNYYNDTDYRTIDDIVGVVVFIIPLVGHVSLFLQTTEGKIIAFGLLLFLLVFPEVFDRLRNQPVSDSK